MSERKKPVAKAKTGIYRSGYIVALVLAVVTVIEYYIALTLNSFSIMMLLGLVKAYLVVNYFMHIKSLWSDEESH